MTIRSVFRSFSAILTAIALMSLVQNFLSLESNLSNIVLATTEAWRSLVRPLVHILFGWAFSIFSVEVTSQFYDYLAFGMIFGAISIRSWFYANEGQFKPISYVALPARMAVVTLLWPSLIIAMTLLIDQFFRPDRDEQVVKQMRMILETLILAGGVLILNYAITLVM